MRGPVQRVRSVVRPDGYHGRGVRSGFFEGWYVKLVSADRSARWAAIPGVFLGTDGDDHAFVQVLDGSTGRSWYLRYDVADFWASPDRFDVRVGPSRFTERGVSLDLPEGLLRGDVAFTDPLDPWPVTLRSPGIMGWYAWVPFMECYHGICSFGHGLAGTLEVEGATTSFDGGRGYLEKDWGQAFPAGYVWVHSNHLEADPQASLTGSVALIPWLRGSFRGFIVGLRTRDRLYRWATYTGAREDHLEIDDSHVRWGLSGSDGRIELVAERSRGGLLHAPVRTSMHERVEETLDARVHVTVHDAAGRRVLDSDADVAALEVVGDLDRLLAVGTR